MREQDKMMRPEDRLFVSMLRTESTSPATPAPASGPLPSVYLRLTDPKT